MHEIEVEVVLLLTVTVVEPELVLWLESPLYVPAIVAVPDSDAVNVTEHEPATNVHDGALKVPVAVPVAVKLTVPVGVVGVPDVSATVAVQVVAWLITTGDGLHAIVVLVV